MKLALERVQADVQNAARDTKWPTMNAKVVLRVSGLLTTSSTLHMLSRTDS